MGHGAVPQHGDAFSPRALQQGTLPWYVQHLFCQGEGDRMCTTGCFWRYQWSLSTAPHCRDAASLASVQEDSPTATTAGKETPSPVKSLPAELCSSALYRGACALQAAAALGSHPKSGQCRSSHLHARVQSRALLKLQGNGSCRDPLLLGEEIFKLKATSKTHV